MMTTLLSGEINILRCCRAEHTPPSVQEGNLGDSGIDVCDHRFQNAFHSVRKKSWKRVPLFVEKTLSGLESLTASVG